MRLGRLRGEVIFCFENELAEKLDLVQIVEDFTVHKTHSDRTDV